MICKVRGDGRLQWAKESQRQGPNRAIAPHPITSWILSRTGLASYTRPRLPDERQSNRERGRLMTGMEDLLKSSFRILISLSKKKKREISRKYVLKICSCHVGDQRKKNRPEVMKCNLTCWCICCCIKSIVVFNMLKYCAVGKLN